MNFAQIGLGSQTPRKISRASSTGAPSRSAVEEHGGGRAYVHQATHEHLALLVLAWGSEKPLQILPGESIPNDPDLNLLHPQVTHRLPFVRKYSRLRQQVYYLLIAGYLFVDAGLPRAGISLFRWHPARVGSSAATGSPPARLAPTLDQLVRQGRLYPRHPPAGTLRREDAKNLLSVPKDLLKLRSLVFDGRAGHLPRRIDPAEGSVSLYRIADHLAS